jgi:hypothetical protein
LRREEGDQDRRRRQMIVWGSASARGVGNPRDATRAIRRDLDQVIIDTTLCIV